MKRAMMAAVLVLIACGTARLVAQRFDNAVRGDFFAGYRGDAARLDRGMKYCERALAEDPNNAAALVWHGGGLMFRSGEAFRRGDVAGGLELRRKALDEMNAAVAMRPDDLQVLIPRGATLLASAPYSPDADAQPMLRSAVGDYEKALALQAPHAADLGVHARGELLGGLATGYRLLGARDRATEYLRRIVTELPGTPYAEKASRWLEGLDRVPRHEGFCLGCHE